MKSISDGASSMIIVVFTGAQFVSLVIPLIEAIVVTSGGFILAVTAFMVLRKSMQRTEPKSTQVKLRHESLIIAIICSLIICITTLLFNAEMGILKPFPLRWVGGGRFELNK